MGEKKPNFLESLWGDMKKKRGEKKMDSMGQELMTPEQEESSKSREDYLQLKKEMGIDGEFGASCIEKEYWSGVGGDVAKVVFHVEENGHKIEGRYYVAYTDYCPDGVVALGTGRWANLTIDGKPCEANVAMAYVEKIDPIARAFIFSKMSDVEAQKQLKANEERQMARAKLDIMLSKPPEQREQPRV